MKNIKSLGFSLIEVVIAVSILGLISVAISSSFLEMFSNQQKVIDKTTMMGIDGALADYFSSPNFCSSSLVGMRVNNQPKEFVIKGFDGFGSNGNDLKSGSLIGDSVKIESATLKINAQMDPVKTFHDNKEVTANILDLVYGFSIKDKVIDQERWMAKKSHTLMLPVKLDSSNRIVACDAGNSTEAACAAVGGTWKNGVCEPSTVCQNTGVYVSWICSGVRNNHPDICGTSLVSMHAENGSIGTVIDERNKGGITNPNTGSLSCPSGSSKSFAGSDSHSYANLSCGKKCSYTVSQSAQFYNCLKCNK